MQHKMLFLQANGDIPFGYVTSTARKGRKWFDKVTPGDTLAFHFTETGEFFGRAAVVKVEVVTFRELLQRAVENHAFSDGETPEEAAEALGAGLAAAYGPSEDDYPFTMVHFIRLNATRRDMAYAAVDSERDYQDALRAASPNPGNHSVAAMVLFMDEYLSRAKHIASTDWSAECDLKTLVQIRKVAALGIATLEDHGAPLQAMPDGAAIENRVAPIS